MLCHLSINYQSPTFPIAITTNLVMSYPSLAGEVFPDGSVLFITHDLVNVNGPRRRRVGRPNAYTIYAAGICHTYCIPTPDHCQNQNVGEVEGETRACACIVPYASAIYKPAWKVLFVLVLGLQAARICLATE